MDTSLILRCADFGFEKASARAGMITRRAARASLPHGFDRARPKGEPAPAPAVPEIGNFFVLEQGSGCAAAGAGKPFWGVRPAASDPAQQGNRPPAPSNLSAKSNPPAKARRPAFAGRLEPHLREALRPQP